MAKKKKASAVSRQRSPKTYWKDEVAQILQRLTKASPSAMILVFSSNGDLVFQSKTRLSLDTTSIGALVTAIEGARGELNRLFKIKTDMTNFSQGKQSFWLKALGNWVVVGLNVKASKSLESLYRLLKKHGLDGQDFRRGTSEAFDGLTGVAVEAALKTE